MDNQHVKFELTDEQKERCAPMFQMVRDSIPAGPIRRVEPKFAIVGQVMAATGTAEFYLVDVQTTQEIQAALNRMIRRKRESHTD